jgi:selenocysteine lyase/cysteine desulfurase
MVGAAAAVDFLAGVASSGGSKREQLTASFRWLHSRGEALFRQLRGGLANVDGVTLYGPPAGASRTPTLSFTLEGISTNDIARDLAKRGLFVSNGDFYAMTVIERIGQAADGVVRIGCSCYTSEDEVGRLVDAVGELARRR